MILRNYFSRLGAGQFNKFVMAQQIKKDVDSFFAFETLASSFEIRSVKRLIQINSILKSIVKNELPNVSKKYMNKPEKLQNEIDELLSDFSNLLAEGHKLLLECSTSLSSSLEKIDMLELELIDALGNDILMLGSEIETGAVKIAFPEKTPEQAKNEIDKAIRNLMTTIQRVQKKEGIAVRSANKVRRALSSGFRMVTFNFSMRSRLSGWQKKKYNKFLEAHADLQEQISTRKIRQDFLSLIIYITKNLRKIDKITEKLRNDINLLQGTIIKICDGLVDNTAEFYAFIQNEPSAPRLNEILQFLKDDLEKLISKENKERMNMDELLKAISDMGVAVDLTLSAIKSRSRSTIEEYKKTRVAA